LNYLIRLRLERDGSMLMTAIVSSSSKTYRKLDNLTFDVGFFRM